MEGTSRRQGGRREAEEGTGRSRRVEGAVPRQRETEGSGAGSSGRGSQRARRKGHGGGEGGHGGRVGGVGRERSGGGRGLRHRRVQDAVDNRENVIVVGTGLPFCSLFSRFFGRFWGRRGLYSRRSLGGGLHEIEECRRVHCFIRFGSQELVLQVIALNDFNIILSVESIEIVFRRVLRGLLQLILQDGLDGFVEMRRFPICRHVVLAELGEVQFLLEGLMFLFHGGRTGLEE